MSKTITKFITEFKEEGDMEGKADSLKYRLCARMADGTLKPLSPEGVWRFSDGPLDIVAVLVGDDNGEEEDHLAASHLDRLKHMHKTISRRHRLPGPESVEATINRTTTGKAWDAETGFVHIDEYIGKTFSIDDIGEGVVDGNAIASGPYPEFIPETKLTATACTYALKEGMASAERINELANRIGDSLADRWLNWIRKEEAMEDKTDEVEAAWRQWLREPAFAGWLEEPSESEPTDLPPSTETLIEGLTPTPETLDWQPVDFDPSQVKAWGVHQANDQTIAEVNRIRARIEAVIRARAADPEILAKDEPQWKPVVHVITKDGLPAITSEPKDTDQVISEEEFMSKIRDLKGGMPSLAKPVKLRPPCPLNPPAPFKEGEAYRDPEREKWIKEFCEGVPDPNIEQTEDAEQSDTEAEFDELLKDASFERKKR